MLRSPPCSCGWPPEAVAVVNDGEDDALVTALERNRHRRRFSMAGDVRQALLRDAIDGKLHVGRQFRQCWVELTLDVQSLTRVRTSSTTQSERSRDRDARASQGAARWRFVAPRRARRRTACLAASISVAVCRHRFGDRVHVQQDTGQHLPYLVMKVASNSDAFSLLRCEDAPAALLALVLEPVEHLIEGSHDAADFVVASDLQTLAPSQEIHRLPSGAPAARAARAPASEEVRSLPGLPPSPTMMINACSSLIGALIVTGVTISRTANAASRPPFTAKTRQKSGTLRSILRR